ncbi:MAG: PQQ-dependent sugar dehydrogenase [Bacteroidota bacterium]
MIKYSFKNRSIKKSSVVILTCLFFINQLISQTFPAGFSQVKMMAIESATAMAFAPDGRLFVCQKTGQVRIIKNGVLLATPFLTLTVDQNGERGISGITFDPNFNTNKHVYIYYTRTTPTIHNRLSRFTANGDVVVAGSEVALLDAEPLNAVFHNGGGLGFGPDGKIYLSMGEDNKPNNAQNMAVYKGKLLRINKDGSAPADNPYISSTSEVTKKIWCLGLRNPYTLAFQPGTGKLFINNVGADNWEEVHDGTLPKKNFGWPAVEGNSNDPTYTNPIFSYPHESAAQKGCAITGGTFFNPSSTNYPAQYNGKYFYMDYCNGWMNYLTLGSTVTTHTFSSGMGTKNLALQVGPDGNLYYIKRDDAKAGIYKIIYSNNNAPAITQHPVDKTITQGQSVTFNVSASGATPLTYQWRKNGVNITGATAASYTINNVQSSHAGQYSARVTNSFGNATSNNATLTVAGFNAQPVAQINTPAEGTKFRAGDVINFSGNATDTEDGTLPASAFEWTVEFHHNNNHFHPGPVIPEGIKSGSFTTSNTDHTSANIFYRLKLKVTDSHGLIDTAHVDIHPITSTITINTQPPGLDITFDSQPQQTPFSALTVEGLLIQIGAVTPQTKNGKTYIFDHWNHGGNASQTIKVGSGDSSYTAVFEETQTTSCIAKGNITRDYWTNFTGANVSDIPVNTNPTNTSQLTIFEGPTNAGNNYASRIRGYICPPTTGNYIFWIASDNSSELWLSTNDQPANKAKIASVTGYTTPRNWTKYPEQKSANIHLTAGTSYYIEALHREGDQGDNIAVGWQLPNGVQERPIPGSRLSPYENTTPPPTGCEAKITPGSSTTFCAGGNILLKATTGAGFTYQWRKNGTNIAGATASSYTANSSGDYQLKITAEGCEDWSAPIKVTVNTSLTAKITPGGPTTFCSGGNVKLFANTCSGYIYQWRKNSVDIPGATGASYIATSSGNYQVKIVQGAAVAWSAQQSVTVNACSEADTIFTIPGSTSTTLSDNHFKVDVYPNPNTGLFAFEICLEEAEEEIMQINVLNSMGQQVYSKPAQRINGCIRETIELSNTLATGMYMLQLSVGDKTENTRILLTK